MKKSLSNEFVLLLKLNHTVDEQLHGEGYVDNVEVNKLLTLKEGRDIKSEFIRTNKKLLTLINLINSKTKRKFNKLLSSKLVMNRLSNTVISEFNSITIDGVSIKMDLANRDKVISLHNHYVEKLIYSKPLLTNDFSDEEANETYSLISETINISMVIWKTYISLSDTTVEDFLQTLNSELSTILSENFKLAS